MIVFFKKSQTIQILYKWAFLKMDIYWTATPTYYVRMLFTVQQSQRVSLILLYCVYLNIYGQWLLQPRKLLLSCLYRCSIKLLHSAQVGCELSSCVNTHLCEQHILWNVYIVMFIFWGGVQVENLMSDYILIQ